MISAEKDGDHNVRLLVVGPGESITIIMIIIVMIMKEYNMI